VEGAGHLALALKLARIADVDQDHVVAARKLDRLGGRDFLDLALGRIDQGLRAGRDFRRH
jgi:hypothetical protein